MTYFRFALSVAILAALGTAHADEETDLAKYDERVLNDAGLGTNGVDVLAFFRKRTLSADDLPLFEKFLEMLNDCDDVQEIYHNVALPS